MSIDPARVAVLALHWQVNVVRPEGFFGGMLAEPVARSGVVARAAAFHAGARAGGVPVAFTRFTVPEGEGRLVRNSPFMAAVGAAQESFRPDAPGTRIVPEIGRHWRDPVFDNQRLSGLSGPITGWLVGAGYDTLMLTGVATNLTVEQTARHGTEMGYRVYVIGDCAAAADEAVHEASLANLALTTEGVLTAAEALAMLPKEFRPRERYRW
ncbi:cysteine hydrolase [Allonocardiopsis opalescens]|uniref:Nicotinamidase-related amidase n=1 Tax=Allonocardiopsis opalescens TaxID=1144618 RepID=A0A2T0Q9W6_9ACTN|nr:cysteine hydrolase [Allonocardiopsis opalescens]PRY00627.1 nicotinamidase-related amidase [Allonocardiopsis opalescens]